MSTTIYFVRHAEVENPNNLLYGRLPGFPLSALGKIQAEKLANFFANKKVAAIYSSPQLRCRQTASFIALPLYRKVGVSCLIQEVGSSFDGITKEEFEKVEPDISDSKPLTNYRRESVAEIQKRMRLFVNRMIRNYPNREVIAVSHGDPIVILRAYFQSVPFNWNFKKTHYVAKGRFLKIVV